MRCDSREVFERVYAPAAPEHFAAIMASDVEVGRLLKIGPNEWSMVCECRNTDDNKIAFRFGALNGWHTYARHSMLVCETAR